MESFPHNNLTNISTRHKDYVSGVCSSHEVHYTLLSLTVLAFVATICTLGSAILIFRRNASNLHGRLFSAACSVVQVMYIISHLLNIHAQLPAHFIWFDITNTACQVFDWFKHASFVTLNYYFFIGFKYYSKTSSKEEVRVFPEILLYCVVAILLIAATSYNMFMSRSLDGKVSPCQIKSEYIKEIASVAFCFETIIPLLAICGYYVFQLATLYVRFQNTKFLSSGFSLRGQSSTKRHSGTYTPPDEQEAIPSERQESIASVEQKSPKREYASYVESARSAIETRTKSKLLLHKQKRFWQTLRKMNIDMAVFGLYVLLVMPHIFAEFVLIIANYDEVGIKLCPSMSVTVNQAWGITTKLLLSGPLVFPCLALVVHAVFNEKTRQQKRTLRRQRPIRQHTDLDKNLAQCYSIGLDGQNGPP